MGQPAAKQGDRIVATDTHTVMVPPPGPGPLVPTPLPHPFSGTINAALSADVNVMGRPAATVGSSADNAPAHVPTAPGVSFQRPPANKARISTGSASVRINGKMAARNGDGAETCNDPADAPVGTVIASGSVMVG